MGVQRPRDSLGYPQIIRDISYSLQQGVLSRSLNSEVQPNMPTAQLQGMEMHSASISDAVHSAEGPPLSPPSVLRSRKNGELNAE